MHILKTQLVSMYHQLYFLPPLSCFHAHLLALSHIYICVCVCAYIDDLVLKGVRENRTKGVENKVDDTLKLVVFLKCAQC